MLLGISNYSFSENATASELNNIAALHPGTDDQIGNMLLQSVSLIGIPYKWGGNTPDSGLDCSGFIRYIFKQSLGITLPRTANEMAKLGRKISFNQLQPGDLIFFNINGGQHISHMGMYLGQNKFIQSPRTGKDIEISEFNQYYQSKLVVAKRMVEEEANTDGQPTLYDIRNEKDPFNIKGPTKKRRHPPGRH